MPTLLVVDDEAQLRLTLRAHLQREGFQLVEAEDGRAALKVIEGHKIDLALIDILMPNMDGIEMIRALRAQDARLPIIAMSGGGRLDARDMLSAARKLGADATIAKPFSMKDVLKMIHDLLAAQSGDTHSQ